MLGKCRYCGTGVGKPGYGPVMPVPHLELRPSPHPVTLQWLGHEALWSWEVMHSPTSWTVGIVGSEEAARTAAADALIARGGSAIVQNCALGRITDTTSQYAYGPLVMRAELGDDPLSVRWDP